MPFGKNEIFFKQPRLWKQHWDGDSVRLLGVTATEIEWKTESVKQLDLFSFEEDAKEEPLLAVIDQINDKYGMPLYNEVVNYYVSKKSLFSKIRK